MHVTFDESYLRNVKKGIPFHDADVSSEDILKDIEERIDHPKSAEPENEEDDDPVKEKEGIPTKMNNLPFSWKTSKDHSIDNILGDITKGVTTYSKISNLCY